MGGPHGLSRSADEDVGVRVAVGVPDGEGDAEQVAVLAGAGPAVSWWMVWGFCVGLMPCALP
ncbi:hypothetical protein [Streptomyces griseorubiginosus]